jgi:hypothetical protein
VEQDKTRWLLRPPPVSSRHLGPPMHQGAANASGGRQSGPPSQRVETLNQEAATESGGRGCFDSMGSTRRDIYPRRDVKAHFVSVLYIEANMLSNGSA